MEAAAHAPTDHQAEEQKKFYAFFNLAMIMAAITGIELVIIFLPLPIWFVYLGVVLLSVIKFFGVILWFMHLIYDNKLLTLIFVSALIIATGTVTALLLVHHERDTIPIGGEEEAVQAIPGQSAGTNRFAV